MPLNQYRRELGRLNPPESMLNLKRPGLKWKPCTRSKVYQEEQANLENTKLSVQAAPNGTVKHIPSVRAQLLTKECDHG